LKVGDLARGGEGAGERNLIEEGWSIDVWGGGLVKVVFVRQGGRRPQGEAVRRSAEENKPKFCVSLGVWTIGVKRIRS